MKTGLCLLLLCSALQLHAQLSFRGIVTDAHSRKPVNGATIRLEGPSNQGTVSHANGSFSINSLQPGVYTLQVSYIGYATVKRTVTLNQDIPDYAIVLQPSSLLVQPIEITGIRAGKDAPFSKTEISAQQLQAANLGQDLPYLLSQQPSVVVNSDAGTGIGYTGIYIRGTDATRINVTFNGIPVNDAESQGTFWVDIPDIASSTSSIQVQRGVGSSTNGAGAFGATINVSTTEFHDSAYAEVNSAYGSFNTFKTTVKAGTGLLNDHFTVDARLSKVLSSGYIDRATADLQSVYLSGAYLSGKTAIRMNVFSGKEKTYQAWDGVPEDSLSTHRTYNDLGLKPDGTFYDDQTDNYQQDYYQLLFNHSVNAALNYSAALFLTRGKGYYEEYKIAQPYSKYGLPDPVVGDSILQSTDLVRDRWLDNYYYGAIFSLNHSGRLNWSLGGGGNAYDGKHYGKVIWAQYAIDQGYQYYYNTAYKRDFNIYWKGDKPITEKLSAYLDLQYRYVQYHINGFDDNPELIQRNRYHFLNPKAGLSYHIDEHQSAYISYAIAGKEPNRDDYEANQAQTPKAEHLQDWEAGYDVQGSFYAWHTNLYYMRYKDQLALTGQINDVGAYTRTNIPDSYRAGIELYGHIIFARIFSLAANATFSRNKIKDFTEYLDDYDNDGQKAVYHHLTDIAFSPATIAGATLSVRPLKSFDINWSSRYVGQQYLDNSSSTDRAIPHYWVNNLLLNYTLHPGWIREIGLQLQLNNIFDAMYVSNGYTYAYIEGGRTVADNNYFPQAGRNILFGVSIKF